MGQRLGGSVSLFQRLVAKDSAAQGTKQTLPRVKKSCFVCRNLEWCAFPDRSNKRRLHSGSTGMLRPCGIWCGKSGGRERGCAVRGSMTLCALAYGGSAKGSDSIGACGLVDHIHAPLAATRDQTQSVCQPSSCHAPRRVTIRVTPWWVS